MPTQATVDRWKRRAELAEAREQAIYRARQDALDELEAARAERASAMAARDEVAADLAAIDTEARLVADLQAAVERYEQRVAQGRGGRYQGRGGGYYGEAVLASSVSREPYRPALASPLGRALLMLAARHEVAIEATVIYPDPSPDPTLVALPPHLAAGVERLVQQEMYR